MCHRNVSFTSHQAPSSVYFPHPRVVICVSVRGGYVICVYVCAPTLSTVKTIKRFINARLVVAGFYKVLLLLTLGVE